MTVTMVDVSQHSSRGPCQQFNVSLFQLCSEETDEGYMEWVSKFVSTNKGESFTLKKPAGARLTIGDLHDTIYRGKDDELYEWEQFYLPETVKMQVVGVVENTLCLCDQLVLMTCKDRKVYAYDGEKLHEVAQSLDQLCYKNIVYPSQITYYKGEAFKDMTEKDWEEVRRGNVGKRLDEEHRKLVTENKSEILENLKLIRGNRSL
ncbi:uncharacterized protein LOC113154676 isoform X2 [Anabas testudineus]|uniref:uncharacterized protein LOC113154676 isoform X2 n=1 Tax=Anabas testudineus TaxID=64144 RepID=UPI000E458379|nr:uncharacterized protein LOC113154676 isoform X2 [Anabas testudineus]